MKDREYFTVVFMGDLRSLEGNPFWYTSEFGVPISIAVGHALEELDELKTENISNVQHPKESSNG